MPSSPFLALLGVGPAASAAPAMPSRSGLTAAPGVEAVTVAVAVAGGTPWRGVKGSGSPRSAASRTSASLRASCRAGRGRAERAGVSCERSAEGRRARVRGWAAAQRGAPAPACTLGSWQQPCSSRQAGSSWQAGMHWQLGSHSRAAGSASLPACSSPACASAGAWPPNIRPPSPPAAPAGSHEAKGRARRGRVGKSAPRWGALPPPHVRAGACPAGLPAAAAFACRLAHADRHAA